MDENTEHIIVCKAKIKDDIIKARYKLSELPPSRETSLVRTKLDEALMWLREVTDQLPATG